MSSRLVKCQMCGLSVEVSGQSKNRSININAKEFSKRCIYGDEGVTPDRCVDLQATILSFGPSPNEGQTAPPGQR